MSDVFVNESELHYQSFLQIGEQLQQLAKSLGKSVITIHKTDDPHFLKLTLPDQQAVLERLKIFRQLFEMSSLPGSPPVNEKKLLWLALKLLKFIPSSDLMNMITDDDFVEVFVGSRQVYRSFNYYDICSYSFDELESLPWENLFRREDTSIFEAMVKEATAAIQTKKMVYSQTPEHIVSETSSPFQNKIKYKLKYIIPIKDAESARNDCFVTVLSASLLETIPKEERVERMKKHQSEREMVTQLF